MPRIQRQQHYPQMSAEIPAEGDAWSEQADSDRCLVERTLGGDKNAFTALHRRYYARIYRLALFRCRNAADAEDIAAETFVRAIAHLPTYRFQGEFLFPWLSRIVSNLVADRGRQRRGATVISLDEPTADGVRALIEGLPGTTAPDPHAMAERHEVQEIIRAAVARLPPDQADAVLLRFGGDMPLKEIALALNKTEGAVKSLLHRAITSLRKSFLSDVQGAEALGLLRGNALSQTDTTTTTAAANTTYGRFHDLI